MKITKHLLAAPPAKEPFSICIQVDSVKERTMLLEFFSLEYGFHDLYKQKLLSYGYTQAEIAEEAQDMKNFLISLRTTLEKPFEGGPA